ncbi:MAG: hypothetical protein QXL94_05610 [Candidatus Parvarchaeum sp.]
MEIKKLRIDLFKVSDGELLGVKLPEVYILFTGNDASVQIFSEEMPSVIRENFEVVITKFIEVKVYYSPSIDRDKIYERAIRNTFSGGN